MGGNSIVVNVAGGSEGDCPARVCELCSLKKVLVEWGMEEGEAKKLAVRLVYGGNLPISTSFAPQTPQSEQ